VIILVFDKNKKSSFLSDLKTLAHRITKNQKINYIIQDTKTDEINLLRLFDTKKKRYWKMS